jgi:DNA-binding transcriptional LysR family regulator
LELRQLEAFVAVADELHFGRAAERLHVAQSPLSQRILRLERELGVRLFERTNRRVRLAEAGALLLPQARSTLAAADSIVRVAEAAREGLAGRLRLGYVASCAFGVLPAVLRAFRLQAPEVGVELHRLQTAAQLQALAAGQLDLGIARAVTDRGPVAVQPLMVDPLVMVLPAGHRLADAGGLSLGQLADEDWVLTAGTGELARHIQRTCHQAGFEPRRAHEAPDQPTILGLVAAGLGVSLVPASVARIRPAQVTTHPLGDPGSALELNLIWRADCDVPTVDRFRQAIRAISFD